MKKDKIDISIIVPIYNAEKYLKKCLDSLINQTKKELEFILINDGSTDNSENIIKSNKDKRIIYIKQENKGIGKTRNLGIKHARGKYIMFLDSDDYLELNACERLYLKCEKEKIDLLVCDFYKEYHDSKEPIYIPFFETATLKEKPDLLNIINLGPSNKLFLKELIITNNIKFEENKKYEDIPFVMGSLIHAKKIAKLNECLHYYVIHSNSETTVRDERCFDLLEVVKKIRNKYQNKKYISDELNKLTVRMITNYTVQQRMQKEKKVAKKFINQAFDYLEKEIPDYKNNKYYENRGILKRTIEKNKLLTKIYCMIYRSIHK